MKQAVSEALGELDPAQVADTSRRWACELVDNEGQRPPFGFALSVYVLGSQLGVPPDHLERIARWMSNFVYCLSPASTPEQIDQGIRAAEHLRDYFSALLEHGIEGATHGLLHILDRRMRENGVDDGDTVVANGIGFLSQAYEATAGLIGNTLVALQEFPDVREAVASRPAYLRHVILEVLRYDPPIQNTRRFVVRAGTIAGERLMPGETVLVLLAAANRDPTIYREPDRFNPDRGEHRQLTFGTGVHACPGQEPASIIARAAVEFLNSSDRGDLSFEAPVTYYSSVNARIPRLPRVTIG